MVDITLLGCGGNLPMPNRNLSSLFLSYKGKSILLDCGEGTQIAMRKYGTGFKDLDLILISHLHGDHTFGLPGLLSSMTNCGKTDRLTIVGPVGIQALMDAILPMIGFVPYDIEVIEDPQGVFCLENHPVFRDIEIAVLPLKHSATCLGYALNFKRQPEFSVEKAKANHVPMAIWKRLQKEPSVDFEGVIYTSDMVLGKERAGIKLSFIADTRYFPEIAEFVESSNLLVCEAMYGDPADILKAEKNQHMIFAESAKIASEGRVKRLILTHFSPSMESPEDFLWNATEIYRDAIPGYDGMKINLHYE